MWHGRIVAIKHGNVIARGFALLALGLGSAAVEVAVARPLPELHATGYVLRRSLLLAGDYHGCRRHTEIAFAGGGALACEMTSFRYVPRPSLLLLDDPQTGDRVLLAPGGEELVGTLEHVPGLPPHLRIGTGDTDPVPKPDAPVFPETGAVLAVEPIVPTAAAMSGLERAEPAIAPFHDDGVPHRNAHG